LKKVVNKVELRLKLFLLLSTLVWISGCGETATESLEQLDQELGTKYANDKADGSELAVAQGGEEKQAKAEEKSEAKSPDETAASEADPAAAVTAQASTDSDESALKSTVEQPAPDKDTEQLAEQSKKSQGDAEAPAPDAVNQKSNHAEVQPSESESASFNLSVAFADADSSLLEQDLPIKSLVGSQVYDSNSLADLGSNPDMLIAGVSMVPAIDYELNLLYPKSAELSTPRLALLPEFLPVLEGAVGNGWARVDVRTKNGDTIRLCYSGEDSQRGDAGNTMVFVRAKLIEAGRNENAPCQQNSHNIDNFNFLVDDAVSFDVELTGGGVNRHNRIYTEILFNAVIFPAEWHL